MTFFHWLARRFTAWMSGRNGVDQLAFVSLIVSLALQLIASAAGLSGLMLFSMALYGWTLFRIFSRKSYRREEENKKYLSLRNSLTTKTRQFFLRLRLSKEFKYFRCPRCKALLRMKRGEGEKEVCCPKCQNCFRMKA